MSKRPPRSGIDCLVLSFSPPSSPPRRPPRPPPPGMSSRPPPPLPPLDWPAPAPRMRPASQDITRGARIGNRREKIEESARLAPPRRCSTVPRRSPNMWPRIFWPSPGSTFASGFDWLSSPVSWSWRAAAARASALPLWTSRSRPPSKAGSAVRAASIAVSGSVPTLWARSFGSIWPRISSTMLAIGPPLPVGSKSILCPGWGLCLGPDESGLPDSSIDVDRPTNGRSGPMATVIAAFSMSLDGFVALPDDSVGPLFDWYGNGPVRVEWPGNDMVSYVTPASARYLDELVSATGAVIAGRRIFDHTGGWNGSQPLGVPIFVVTHSIPEGWPRDDAPATFVTEGVEQAVALASEVA